MTEYEIATLASRSLGHWLTAGQIAATLVIGAGQIAIFWYGIRTMRRATDQRATAADHDRLEARERHEEARQEARERHEEAHKRHEEAMLALRTLIERTAPTTGGER